MGWRWQLRRTVGERVIPGVGPGRSRDGWLILLAAVIGSLTGLVATGFDVLVEGSTELFYGLVGGRLLPGLPGAELWLLVLLPGAGGLAVGLVMRAAGRQKSDPGIPDVVEALARRHGEVRGRSGILKAITSSLTIGSGGSAGVEGPIITIGSSLGSSICRLLRVAREHRPAMLGCGAAAATAAIFNAPIAGVIFVLEIILRDFSLRTFIPIVVASVFGTAVAQAVLGQNEAVFYVPEAVRLGYTFNIIEIGHYAVLGVLCGLLGAAFIRTLRVSEKLWTKLPLPFWCKPALGGVALGLLGVGFYLLGFGDGPVVGHNPPTFFGNGYPVIEALLNPDSYAPGISESEGTLREASIALLGLTLLLKLVGTSLTLGSGGSGGVIAPSLLLGATLGGGFALLCESAGLFPGATPATFALAGMAGVIAAVAHCPLTAFLLVFEITADYQVILPVMLVSILATSVAQLIFRDSIYAQWLRDRGIKMGTYSDLTLLRRMTCHDVPLTPAVMVHAEDPAARLIELADDYAVVDYVVTDDAGRYAGMVVGQDVRATLVQREAIPLMIVAELTRTHLPTVSPQQTLDVVLEQFARHDVSSLAVVDANDRVKGVITRSRLMRQYQQALSTRG
ncbi:MAG: chloride channel protein [Planctomycetota bacterium]